MRQHEDAPAASMSLTLGFAASGVTPYKGLQSFLSSARGFYLVPDVVLCQHPRPQPNADSFRQESRIIILLKGRPALGIYIRLLGCFDAQGQFIRDFHTRPEVASAYRPLRAN